jgi:hypothetical protein
MPMVITCFIEIMGTKINILVDNVWLQSLKGRDHSQDIGVDDKIILKWILGK